MPGCDWQTQQNLFLQQIQQIQPRLRQNAVAFIFIIAQRIQAGLIAQHQTHIEMNRIIHCIQATLATQLALPRDTDVQQRIASTVQSASHRIA